METRIPPGCEPILRALRIIVLALAGGVGAFLVVVVAVRLHGHDVGATGGTPVISYAAACALLASLAARALVLGALATQGRAQIREGRWRDGSGATAVGAWRELLESEGDGARLLALYQSRTVIGSAILEAAGLLGAVAHLLEGGWLGPGVSVVASGVILALHYPTRDAVEEWLSAQSKLLEEERGA